MLVQCCLVLCTVLLLLVLCCDLVLYLFAILYMYITFLLELYYPGPATKLSPCNRPVGGKTRSCSSITGLGLGALFCAVMC